jgi:hypothetical protein
MAVLRLQVDPAAEAVVEAYRDYELRERRLAELTVSNACYLVRSFWRGGRRVVVRRWSGWRLASCTITSGTQRAGCGSARCDRRSRCYARSAGSCSRLGSRRRI